MNWRHLVVLPTLAASLHLNAMTLAEFLNEVRAKNLSYQGFAERSAGAALQSREADLFFTPQLFGNAQAGHDAKLTTPGFNYDKVESQLYSLGVSQQFDFGLETKLSYELSNTHFVGANLGAGVATNYWDASPKIELFLPFWKNGFGRTAKSSRDLTRSQFLADQYSSQAQAQAVLVEAEIAYWRLSAAQEQLKIQEQALLAGRSILSYVSRKNDRNLGDRADVLQADALVEAYQLQLLQTQNEVRAATRSFNIYLNRESVAPAPQLEAFTYAALDAVVVPSARPGDRPDVQAAQAQVKAALASSQLAAERNRPQIDAYATYRLNGRGEESEDAVKDSGSTKRDTALIGVRFQVPLNMMAADDAVEGAAKQRAAAEKRESFLRFEQDQSWNDVVQKLVEAKQTLRVATKMESAQKAKLDNERTRLRQGRTTTYQVLLFEQDYSQAQVARVRSASQILALQTQIKLYQAPTQGGN